MGKTITYSQTFTTKIPSLLRTQLFSYWYYGISATEFVAAYELHYQAMSTVPPTSPSVCAYVYICVTAAAASDDAPPSSVAQSGEERGEREEREEREREREREERDFLYDNIIQRFNCRRR